MTKKLLIIALLSVAVIAVVVTVCLVVFKEDEVLAPDYAPPAIEENAEKIEGDNEEKMEVSGDGSGAIGISYKKTATIDLSDEKIAVYYSNPNRSHNSVLLQIVVKGEVVAQSGTIKPGYRVSTLDLLDGAAARLQAGTYEQDTQIVVYTYDPVTDERTMMKYNLPIIVTVQE